ncbi:MAG: dTMP kinase [Eubacteriales bacterium]
MQGKFITFEGSDGSGKTTQIELVKTYFESKKIDYIFTREPGGTVIGETIREIILDKKHMEMSEKTEALLYAASRAQHVKELIKPALAKGKVVLCDRFVDSSIIYQGMGRGLGEEVISRINEWATGGLKPDLTVLLDLDHKIGLTRKKSQKVLDRLELQKSEFHNIVVEGYKNLAEKNKDRIVAINASLKIEDIHKTIIKAISKVLY